MIQALKVIVLKLFGTYKVYGNDLTFTDCAFFTPIGFIEYYFFPQASFASCLASFLVRANPTFSPQVHTNRPVVLDFRILILRDDDGVVPFKNMTFVFYFCLPHLIRIFFI